MESRNILGWFYALIVLCGTRCYGFTPTTMPNNYMICKSVSGLFDELDDDSDSSTPVLQGPGGGRGPPGNNGLRGPGGEPDYSEVSKILDKKLHSINARLYKAENEARILKNGGPLPTATGPPLTTPSAADKKYAVDCMNKHRSPIHVGPVCYKVIGGEGLSWTFDHAETNCTEIGGYLADLNSRPLYDLIYDYIDRTYSTVVQAWTGMRYQDDELKLTTGVKAVFSKWMAYNPRKSRSSYSTYYRSYTHVYANIDTSSRINGLQNAPSTRRLPFAICHFDISGNPTSRAPTSARYTTTKRNYYDTSSDYYDYD